MLGPGGKKYYPIAFLQHVICKVGHSSSYAVVLSVNNVVGEPNTKVCSFNGYDVLRKTAADDSVGGFILMGY
jgi:hypothetical protein